jgi:hypothetical protein
MATIAAFRPCATPGCPELVPSGHCPRHGQAGRARDRRDTSTARGYGVAWGRFRRRFVADLVWAGIAPVCGATLPGGPAMTASACQRDGRLTGTRLHLHHDPPLTDAERGDVAAVCDPRRVGFLCESCHNAETARAAGRPPLTPRG